MSELYSVRERKPLLAAVDQKLAAEYNVEMIPPNRRGRQQKTQDGRKLRRYRRRWKEERLFAWMQNFRRLITRWEYHVEDFLGFVHLACLHMRLRHSPVTIQVLWI